jgi:hypothetical protein
VHRVTMARPAVTHRHRRWFGFMRSGVHALQASPTAGAGTDT